MVTYTYLILTPFSRFSDKELFSCYIFILFSEFIFITYFLLFHLTKVQIKNGIIVEIELLWKNALNRFVLK